MLWIFIALFLAMGVMAMMWGRWRISRFHTALTHVAEKRGGRIERMAFDIPQLFLGPTEVPMGVGWIPPVEDEPEHTVAEFRTAAPLPFAWTLWSAKGGETQQPPEGQVEIALDGRLGHRYRVYSEWKHRQDARALIEGPFRDSLLAWPSDTPVAIQVGSWTCRPKSWKRPPGEERGTPVEVAVPSAITDPVPLERFVEFSQRVCEILGRP